jgi:hypothetical protein
MPATEAYVERPLRAIQGAGADVDLGSHDCYELRADPARFDHSRDSILARVRRGGHAFSVHDHIGQATSDRRQLRRNRHRLLAVRC